MNYLEDRWNKSLINSPREYPILDNWYEKYNNHFLSENVNPQKTEQLHENLGLEIGKKNNNVSQPQITTYTRFLEKLLHCKATRHW